MKWMNHEIGLFPCYSNNAGKIRTLRQALLSDFATPHEWFYKDDSTGQWVNVLQSLPQLLTGSYS